MDIWAAFDGRPHRPRLGLRPLDLRLWTDPPPPGALVSELGRRRSLLAGRPAEVLVETPGSEEPAAELLDRLVAHLLADHPARYRRGPGSTILHGRDVGAITVDRTVTVDAGAWSPLAAAAALTAADWCLVRPDARPVLSAGVVCSPNRWRLRDKIGRPLTAVHDPVPGYDTALAAPVDRLLGPDGQARPVWRQNWSMLARPDLFQPDPGGSQPLEVPDGVWVRSERQTLVPLPVTGWWAFGIETACEPLASVSGRPAVATRLLVALTSLDPATAAYKELEASRARLVTWLEGAASVHTTQQHE